jgi:GDP-L-fucose synthase
MELAKRVLVVGGEGVLEKALNRLLSAQGFHPLKTDGVDFSHASQVNAFFLLHRPQLVFLQGGKTRGISGNLADPVGLARENLLVATHVLEAAHRYGVDKLLYIASSCIYPSQAPQPLKIESLLSGPLEVSSEG